MIREKRHRTFHSIDVMCHGTYIWDKRERVQLVERISREQAAKLVGLPRELTQTDYMWLNKGYIVLGRPYRIGNPDYDTNAMTIGDGDPVKADVWSRDLVVGERLVYLADGNYYLVECVK